MVSKNMLELSRAVSTFFPGAETSRSVGYEGKLTTEEAISALRQIQDGGYFEEGRNFLLGEPSRMAVEYEFLTAVSRKRMGLRVNVVPNTNRANLAATLMSISSKSGDGGKCTEALFYYVSP